MTQPFSQLALTPTPLATGSSGRFLLWILVSLGKSWKVSKQCKAIGQSLSNFHMPGGDCGCGSHLGWPHCRGPCRTGSLRWCGGWTTAETLHTVTHCNQNSERIHCCTTLHIIAYHCSVLQYCIDIAQTLHEHRIIDIASLDPCSCDISDNIFLEKCKILFPLCLI